MNEEEKNNYTKINFLKKFHIKILKKYRYKFFDLFRDKIYFDDRTNILDVGYSDSISDHNNIFLRLYPFQDKIISISNQKPILIKNKFPNVNFITCDAKKNLFDDNFFDIVHSNAVIEHVGSFQEQIRFVSECCRVCKDKVFIQTPYRFFPIEVHTKLPLIHFLPKNIARKVYNFLGYNFFAKEENLNLLSINDLNNICKILKLKKYKIFKFKLFGFISNLVLLINK